MIHDHGGSLFGKHVAHFFFDIHISDGHFRQIAAPCTCGEHQRRELPFERQTASRLESGCIKSRPWAFRPGKPPPLKGPRLRNNRFIRSLLTGQMGQKYSGLDNGYFFGLKMAISNGL
jgi:hypothetical protein